MSPNPFGGNNGITMDDLFGAIRGQQKKIKGLERALEEVNALLRAAGDAPKFIEQIPGLRSPYLAISNIVVAANSTARLEGNFTNGADGPFVICAMALYWMRTTGAYQGAWGYVTPADAKIALNNPGLGFMNLLDQPHIGSFEVEVNVSDSGRNWQNTAFASALFAPSQGGVYVFPVQHLVGINATVQTHVTPLVAQTVAGIVRVHFLGYKIVQGAQFQP